MSIRSVLKQSLSLTEGYIVPKDEYAMNNGVLEYKYGGDGILLHDKMKSMIPDLQHLGVTYYSTQPEANIALVTVDRKMARKVNELMTLHNFVLAKAHYGDSLDDDAVLNAFENGNTSTGYGREGSVPGSSTASLGGLFQGYPIDRLAGE
jgi:hypothetical protein